jgi:hypothetical protein
VQSCWNRGTSTSYRGVKLYQSANYTNLVYCVPQCTAWNISDGGTFLRLGVAAEADIASRVRC